MRISVLGLGRMGAPMAQNLLTVGHEVTVFDRDPERVGGMAKSGARVGATVAGAVKDAQVALTMVPDDETVNSLTFGADGLLACLSPGAIHLCMSTIGMDTSRKLALAHAEAGQGYVAAPVFGRPATAVTRQLWIVVGGLDAPVTRCLTIFDTLGRGITRVGSRPELAHALKLGGNMLTAVIAEGLSEVLAFGEKAGLPPAEYLRLMNTAIFRSPMMDAFGGLIVRHAHDHPDITLDSALKDMELAIQASEELDAVMPLAELLLQRLEVASIQGWGALDLTVLSRSSRKAAGLEESETSKKTEDHKKAHHSLTVKVGSHQGDVVLDLHKITHFELLNNAVWAWSSGNRYCTSWRHLAEVEQAFRAIKFVRLHRHILVQPEAALAHKVVPMGTPKKALEPQAEPAISNPNGHLSAYPAKIDEKQVVLGLNETTHFELKHGVIWAWARGRCYRTFWSSLSEIEATFNHVILLRIQRNVLLHPEAVLSLKPAFGGRAKVKVAGDVELAVSRLATPRLKELLGM